MDEREASEGGNVFAAPRAVEQPLVIDDATAGSKRPVAPKVFGILAIVFASLSLLGGFAMWAVYGFLPEEFRQAILQQNLVPTLIIDAALSVAELVLGIGLLRYRAWARKGFLVFCVVAIVYVVVQSVLTVTGLLPSDNQAERLGTAIGAVIGFIFGSAFPVLGLIFLSRPRVRAACH